MSNNSPIKNLRVLLFLVMFVLSGCTDSGSAIEEPNDTSGAEEEVTRQASEIEDVKPTATYADEEPNDKSGAGEEITRQASEIEDVKPTATHAEESNIMTTKNVIVELRIPIGSSADEVFALISADLAEAGFELDTEYQPIPTTSNDELVVELEAANEEVVLVRGTIREEDEEKLKQDPRVIAIWTDARIEPFDS